jgi:hypothetical protein
MHSPVYGAWTWGASVSVPDAVQSAISVGYLIVLLLKQTETLM